MCCVAGYLTVCCVIHNGTCVSTLVKAIVFVVGGGNYIEYLNLQEYAKVRAHMLKTTLDKRKQISPPPLLSLSPYTMISLSLGACPPQRSQPAKRIVYGSSDLVSAKEFLQQVDLCVHIQYNTLVLVML